MTHASDGDEAAQVRRHIEYKTSVRELAPQVGARMIAALDAGAAPDYAALFEQATFMAPPAVCFHTAPTTKRGDITVQGLRGAGGTNWGDKATGQPVGVYVGPEPDTRGMWSHWDEWDVWEVDMNGLGWAHDRLNPGCWVVSDVPPGQVTWVGTYSFNT